MWARTVVAIGTACGVLVVGAGAPDIGTGAMDLGVVQSRDAVAIPAFAGAEIEQLGEAVFQQGLIPVPGFDKGFQNLPVIGAAEGDEGLGDGMFFDIEGQSGDPLDKVSPAPGSVKE